MDYVCLIGSTGMLGSMLLYQLSCSGIKVIAISRSKFKKKSSLKLNNNIVFKEDIDIKNFNSIVEIINQYPIKIIINCVGIIKQKKDSNNEKLMYLVNAIYPNKLSVIAHLMDIKLIHISTDCVFSGSKGNYTENDKLDSKDSYGISKALGELKSKNCLTLRTSIIGHEFYTKTSLLEWFLSQKNSVKGYKNAIFSGFTNLELSKIIINIIKNSPQLEGLYNLASTPINKYDLLKLVAEKYDKNIEIIPDYEFKINRSLDGSKFYSATRLEKTQWQDMIRELHDFYINTDYYVQE